MNTLLNDDGSQKFKVNTYVTNLEIMNFDLTDGTHTMLDRNSDLKEMNEKNVALRGRAHFNVERNEKKQFTIDLPIGKIVVLGTEFTIDASDMTSEVYVEEGSVRYELTESTRTLVAGDLLRVSNNEVVVL